MKSIGVVRKIDELGRVVIPKEIRQVRNWKKGTPLEIFVDKGDIILREYVSSHDSEEVEKRVNRISELISSLPELDKAEIGRILEDLLENK